jgi:hypothetical protein
MFPCLRRVFLLSFHLLALQPTFSAAYSWVLNAPPIQCSNLSINITGSDGVPPYRVLVVPTGPTTLPHNTEVRSVIDHPFDGNSTTTSFAINYPENTEFVAVVSWRLCYFFPSSASGLDSSTPARLSLPCSILTLTGLLLLG